MAEGPRYPGSLIAAHARLYLRQKLEERRRLKGTRPKSAALQKVEQLCLKYEGPALLAVFALGLIKLSGDVFVDHRCEELSSRCEMVEHLASRCQLSMQKLKRLKEMQAFWLKQIPLASARDKLWKLKLQAIETSSSAPSVGPMSHAAIMHLTSKAAAATPTSGAAPSAFTRDESFSTSATPPAFSRTGHPSAPASLKAPASSAAPAHLPEAASIERELGSEPSTPVQNIISAAAQGSILAPPQGSVSALPEGPTSAPTPPHAHSVSLQSTPHLSTCPDASRQTAAFPPLAVLEARDHGKDSGMGYGQSSSIRCAPETLVRGCTGCSIGCSSPDGSTVSPARKASWLSKLWPSNWMLSRQWIRPGTQQATPLAVQPHTGHAQPQSDPAQHQNDHTQSQSDPAQLQSDPAQLRGDPVQPQSDLAQLQSDPGKPQSDPAQPAAYAGCATLSDLARQAGSPSCSSCDQGAPPAASPSSTHTDHGTFTCHMSSLPDCGSDGKQECSSAEQTTSQQPSTLTLLDPLNVSKRTNDGAEHWTTVHSALVAKTRSLQADWEETLIELFRLQSLFLYWRQYKARAHLAGVAIKVSVSGENQDLSVAVALMLGDASFSYSTNGGCGTSNMEELSSVRGGAHSDQWAGSGAGGDQSSMNVSSSNLSSNGSISQGCRAVAQGASVASTVQHSKPDGGLVSNSGQQRKQLGGLAGEEECVRESDKQTGDVGVAAGHSSGKISAHKRSWQVIVNLYWPLGEASQDID